MEPPPGHRGVLRVRQRDARLGRGDGEPKRGPLAPAVLEADPVRGGRVGPEAAPLRAVDVHRRADGLLLVSEHLDLIEIHAKDLTAAFADLALELALAPPLAVAVGRAAQAGAVRVSPLAPAVVADLEIALGASVGAAEEVVDDATRPGLLHRCAALAEGAGAAAAACELWAACGPNLLYGEPSLREERSLHVATFVAGVSRCALDGLPLRGARFEVWGMTGGGVKPRDFEQAVLDAAPEKLAAVGRVRVRTSERKRCEAVLDGFAELRREPRPDDFKTLTVELQGTMPMDRMAELARRLWLTPGVSETRVEACAWIVA